MNEIINIGVGIDVKLTARLVDAQGNAINLNQVTELRAVIYNGDRQRTLSDYNIVDDTSVEFVLRSGTELTAGDQVAISMAIRYKKDGFVNSTPIIEIIHRGWVGEEISPMAAPMAVVNSAITAQFTISVPPAVYYSGASPRIGANGHWYVFDDVTKDYIDSGFGAQHSNEQIIADENERRRQEAIRVAAEVQREQRMKDVEQQMADANTDVRYLREDMDARIIPTADGVVVKGSDDADNEVQLSLSSKNARPKYLRNNVDKELALKEDVDILSTKVNNERVAKTSIVSLYPSIEPVDNTTILSAKEAFKKNKLQDNDIQSVKEKTAQLEQEVDDQSNAILLTSDKSFALNKLDPSRYTIGERFAQNGMTQVENAVMSNIIAINEGDKKVYINNFKRNAQVVFLRSPYLHVSNVVGNIIVNNVSDNSYIDVPTGALYFVVNIYQGGSTIPDLSSCIVSVNKSTDMFNLIDNTYISEAICRQKYAEEEFAKINGGDGYNLVRDLTFNFKSLNTSGIESNSSVYRTVDIILSTGTYKIRSKTGGTTTPILCKYNNGIFEKIVITGSAYETTTLLDIEEESCYKLQYNASTYTKDNVLICRVYNGKIQSDIINLIVNLPVSDGADIQSGYAYIDVQTKNVKVK